MIRLGIQSPIPPKVLQIARKVRRWVIRTHRDSSGRCGVASERIQDELLKIGIQSVRQQGDFIVPDDKWETQPHCWLRIKKYILDVTADQFNDNRVFSQSIIWGTNEQLHQRYERRKLS